MEGGGRYYHGHSATTINLVAIGAAEYGAIMVLLRQFWGGMSFELRCAHRFDLLFLILYTQKSRNFKN